MSDEPGHHSRIWMWCIGLVVLYLASYAPVDVTMSRRGYGTMIVGVVPPDPFAAAPRAPRWMEVVYGPAKRVYNWEPVFGPMYTYYLWWRDHL